MPKIIVSNNKQELNNIFKFIAKELNYYEIQLNYKIQLELAIEEAFVNIVDYAYPPNIINNITIEIILEEDPLKIIITLIDNGNEYNPLIFEHKDIHAPLKEREIGGLGILLIKKNVDFISYKYENNSNFLTLEKNLE
ncbi:ATP-binding protein [Methanobrevibacter sp. DSM 116169]|uniref:ATP-binding protein n=1 Tax=Methanobrevibacter sp. DSM 116169 TaxID=3242727 RepID=UPI0038FC3531